MARKAIRKKIPPIPTAPLVERPPDLPGDLFKGCSSIEAYDSRPFKELDDFEDYAKDLYKAFKKNSKDGLLLDESQFLTELDSALLHYEIFRPIHTPEMSGTFEKQREYFLKLKKALQIKKPSSRLKKVQGRLKEITECELDQRSKALSHLRRLLNAKLHYATFKNIAFASLDPEQSPDNNLINDLDQLNVAVDIVRSDLEGKNSGQHAELYLLIEQLADVYEACIGKRPPKTVPAYKEDKDKGKRKNKSKEKGIFFKFIKSIIPVVHIANDFPKTDSAIFEGIRLLK
jgi:hypothetical protein